MYIGYMEYSYNFICENVKLLGQLKIWTENE